MNYYLERIEIDSVIPAKIYPGTSRGGSCHYPLHWHDNLEFDLVLEGAVRGRVNGRQVEVKEGDFFFVNSGDLHETDVDDRSRIRAITILLSYDLIKEYDPDVEAYFFDFAGNDEAKRKVGDLILECATVYQEKSEFYELEVSIILRRICCILLKECRKARQRVNEYRREQKSITNIKKAITYMENNYMEEISLQSLASEMGMVPTYFSRFIRKTTGDTFYSYLTKIRLYHAYMDLINTNTQITEIALNNGFHNVKSFIEAFKKLYKVTPAKYRSQQLQNK
ncbi:MAG TPA: AraC family transcriptional regulator [Lachnospiraceae bacterium]|nr:AraC family transcriptional regulator [Lachnospiraceae bacterium]